MIYNSFNFIIVFPIIFLLYYGIVSHKDRYRNGFLLIVSYLLYMSWVPAYALILIGITAITYNSAIMIESNKKNRKKIIMVSSICLTLVPLLIFKYYNFFNEILSGILTTVHLHFKLPGLNRAIPIGISFFTFQALGYLWDVYLNRIKSEKNMIDYALFVAFFPSIVSGPINRADIILPQLKKRAFFDYDMAVDGLKMILWGMFMKVVIADMDGMYVDKVVSNYQSYSGLTCFISSILYSIQIYTDFAGYSLMAIGTAKIMGIKMPNNFNRPYMSVSITDFWRRWHISLSTWLRDYVYIPLKGSRCSKVRCYINIFITFLVSGIWHGANWTFVIWGLWHGCMLIMEKMLNIKAIRNDRKWIKALRVMVTFLCINFAWIIFRMPSLQDGLNVIGKILVLKGDSDVFLPGNKDLIIMATGIIILLVKDITDEFWPERYKLFNNKHRIIRWTAYTVIIVMVLSIGVLDSGQFIYANF